MKRKKVLFISSSGGHLAQLMHLKPLFERYDYHLVTEYLPCNEKLKEKYKVSFLLHGGRNNKFKYLFLFLFNAFKSLYILLREKPNVVITTGAHTAVPMCYLAKIFGKKVIYIESFAKVNTPNLSGKLIYPIADLFIVQWPELLKYYPKAKYLGGGLY